MKKFYYFSKSKLKFVEIGSFYKKFVFLVVFFAILVAFFLFGSFLVFNEFINPDSEIKSLKKNNAILREKFDLVLEQYKKLDENTNKVKSYLMEKGINEKEIKISSMNKADVYEGDDGDNGYGSNPYGKMSSSIVKKSEKKFKGFKLNQTITIESGEVEKIEALSRNITELFNQGIDVTPDAPKFMYTKLSDVKLEIISLAAMDAKKRAEEIAKSTDNKIGEIRSSKVGVIQINAKNDFQVSDYGMNDLSSINKNVRATINVSYSIE